MTKPSPGSRSPRRRVPQKDLDRRVIQAVEYVHAAAVEAIGEDVDPKRLRESLLWVFGYLTGGEQAHISYTYGSQDPTQVERLASRAIGAGIQAYAGCLRTEGPPEHAWLADRLEALAARTGGFGPKGHARLELVRDPTARMDCGEEKHEEKATEDDVIPF